MLDGVFATREDGSYEVRFERALAQSIEKVWAALTDPAVLRTWIGEVTIEPKIGGAFILRFNGSSAVMTGEITQFEPPRVIEYTWTEPHYAPALVRWELAPDGAGTRLALTHTAPPEAHRSDVIGYLGGWHDYLDNLPAVLDGRTPEPAESRWAKLDEGYRIKVTGAAVPDARAMFTQTGQVRLERLLPGPIERVWAHLTDAKLLPGWFGDGVIEPRQGGAVTLMDGHIRGVVTQWRPPHFLSYTWNVFEPGAPADAVSTHPESYLSLRLERYGDRVLLTLSHVPVPARFEKQTAMGWHTFLDILAAALAGEAAPARGELMQKNAAAYGVDLQNLAR